MYENIINYFTNLEITIIVHYFNEKHETPTNLEHYKA